LHWSEHILNNRLCITQNKRIPRGSFFYVFFSFYSLLFERVCLAHAAVTKGRMVPIARAAQMHGSNGASKGCMARPTAQMPLCPLARHYHDTLSTLRIKIRI